MSSRACPSACLPDSPCQSFLALSLIWHRLLASSRADTPGYPCNAAGLTCCRATCLPTVRPAFSLTRRRILAFFGPDMPGSPGQAALQAHVALATPHCTGRESILMVKVVLPADGW